MKQAEYMRRGKVIINLATGEAKDHSSINAAKRASHGLQMRSDGRLGAGTLRLEGYEQQSKLKLTKAALKNLLRRH